MYSQVFTYPAKRQHHSLFVRTVGCLMDHNCEEHSTPDLCSNMTHDLYREQLVLDFVGSVLYLLPFQELMDGKVVFSQKN